MAERKARIWLVQQGVWDMPVESLPLASGYLKATADADERIRSEADVRIFNFGGGDTTRSMVTALFRDELPDMVAFSVLGWNFRTFGILAATFRQLRPGGWIVFGGNHVTHQAERVFRLVPEVDVVINGEGERTFRDLLRAYLGDASRHELDAIDGLSFRRPDGEVVTTAPRERIQDLDEIPSPFLSGAVEMTDERGRFRYDVALMETNRGCPYQCAFCYWGGAIGQKLRFFSRDRLREELDLFGYHEVESVVLCDANFGMLRQDETFLEDLLETRSRRGYPRNLETSWAKNKSKIFYRIVRRMKEAGLRSSFTIALQTLNDQALESMQRKNMKLNDWEELADWLKGEGFECYAELIWGVPGETPDTFLEGYDRLARKVSRIAVYPLLLMPNTKYSDSKEDFDLVTVRSDRNDFEYVVRHQTLGLAENQRMHRFLFWARVIAENMIFRHLWSPLDRLAGLRQSRILSNLDRWIDDQDDPAAEELRGYRDEMVKNLDASLVSKGLRFFYEHPQADALLERWWEEAIQPNVPARFRELARELLAYDLVTRPIYAEAAPGADPAVDLPTVEIAGNDFYVRRGVPVRFDVPRLVRRIRSGKDIVPEPLDLRRDLYFKEGFAAFIDNHEFVPHFVGRTYDQVMAAAEPFAAGDEGWRGAEALQ
ncbi:MAG: KedN5 family methylcobalamin-dependent radical SAM C-methyltransferase [Acidobacteriota bacterium]|jgi:radical SAM superfamily enzyme YgiQ (UPF0313 family)